MERLDDYTRAGRTVIVITHAVRLVADHIPQCAILQAGRLVARGETQAVLTQPDLMAATGLGMPPVGRLARQLGMEGAKQPLDVMAFRAAYRAKRSLMRESGR
jgi:ABC-type hemin transport system ATPase subunit